ncbi:Legume-like lectin family and Concanavalin A-like lectin/glucanases superfamily domain and Concanavalin A-like lectin/glucanase, subgroup domain-containing protein [Strongyloides ratti]|uniref:Legume-like lectin family and Concanavalin A-like lectin/glucanases superfamily domain and Concanavalin A-like lectin/glucanase, subgroup domain-containing protein n=1 Tax=Strongyloides ratti TaxID=34506 RepID=A0A090LEW8_STRRB|nr:Legume-like lectin family and Concanavalin A-like lectin/glucanases superfamily domain and Concanavalin A-like lectin/glucanase, subgroup domain-containing protein [Strongyloides ratti]CEF68292.1 Legume-like lectin family and Concanavalin A-like lectin/glucanases superfamily domain and Concanavalin A-like lectin/glucanase, subgroup domain-containing protein [Strongyloides ratti]
MKNLLTYSVITFCLFFLIKGNNIDDEIVGTSVHEYRGYYRREYSLIKPYHSSSSHIPYWEIIGDTEVNNDEVRLTHDEKGKSGIIYNKPPVLFRDWEVMLSFSITGTKERLYGDGIAIWYVKEINRGSAFDTYHNDNKGSDYQFPLIYGMINDGKKEYNIDNDGTSTRLGNKVCSAYFRNQEKGSTNLLLKYFNNTLSIYIDVDGERKWKKCFDVENVLLPTGYIFAISGHTGDLHDTHDILAFRTYELNLNRPNTKNEMSSYDITPQHLDEKQNNLEIKSERNFFYTIKIFFLICITISILFFAIYYGLEYYKNRIAKSRKRFY